MQNSMASNGVEIVGGLRFINETESIINEGLNNGHGDYHRGIKRGHGDDSDTDSEIACALQDGGDQLFNMGQGGSECPKPGKKTKGRVKIKMEFIENKLRRYTTFSKRKTGIMKKAYELSTLTGTQVMLLVASETGHVYTFATRKLQPMITSESGKALIQTCLNTPDNMSGGINSLDQRMNPTGFEETELSYDVTDDSSQGLDSLPIPTKSNSSVQYAQPASSPDEISHANSTLQQTSPTVVSTPSRTLAMTTYLTTPQTVTAPLAQEKPVSSQPSQPVAPSLTPIQLTSPAATQSIATILPSTGIQPGAPITLNQLTGQNQISNQAAPQTLWHRINTPMGGQLLSIPANMASSISQAQTTQSQLRLPTKPNVPAQQQQISQHQTQQQNLSVMSQSQAQPIIVTAAQNVQKQPTPSPLAVLSGQGGQGTVLYQTPQGLVCNNTAGAAGINTLPEGYFINLPQTPTITIQPDQQGGTPQQFIAIPVPVSLAGTTSGLPQYFTQTSTSDLSSEKLIKKQPA